MGFVCLEDKALGVRCPFCLQVCHHHPAHYFILSCENFIHLYNVSWSYSCSTLSLQFSPGSVQHNSLPSIVGGCGPDAAILTDEFLAVDSCHGRQNHFSLGGGWHWEVVHVPLDNPTPAVVAYKRPRLLKIPIWRGVFLMSHPLLRS